LEQLTILSLRAKERELMNGAEIPNLSQSPGENEYIARAESEQN
jgi:hypothetical protein